jgi:hypothetical protein
MAARDRPRSGRLVLLEAARCREHAAEMRRVVLRMDLGRPDGVNIAEELVRFDYWILARTDFPAGIIAE